MSAVRGIVKKEAAGHSSSTIMLSEHTPITRVVLTEAAAVQ